MLRGNLEVKRHRFTARAYRAMGEAGVLGEDDRNVKLPLYARAGISEAWVIDLKAGNVEVHSEPAPDCYRESRSFGSGDRVASGIAEGLSVPVDEALG